MMERYLMNMLCLLILFSSLPLIFAESHSHFFYTTITNDSTYDYPSYCTTRSLDDITLYWYDSDNMVIERRVPWFKSANGSLLNASIAEYNFQRIEQRRLEIYRNYMNDTEGFQVLQLLDGCILYDNGTVDTIFSFHYNGEPFISFNVDNGIWIADDPRAQKFTDLYNENKTMLEQDKNTLENACVPHIIELLSLGNCTLNRKEQPVVVVTQTPITNSTSRLNCRAYGHYPKNISMTWYKRAEPVPESLMERVTLPLPDITYLTQLSVNISSIDYAIYTCSVTHSSMISPFLGYMRLSEDSSDFSSVNSDHNVGGRGISNGGIIGICLAITVLMVVVAFSSIWWANNRRR
ncbi:major histocompatibility complex class I-related gene protein-like [Mantella aurantiaca]